MEQSKSFCTANAAFLNIALIRKCTITLLDIIPDTSEAARKKKLAHLLVEAVTDPTNSGTHLQHIIGVKRAKDAFLEVILLTCSANMFAPLPSALVR